MSGEEMTATSVQSLSEERARALKAAGDMPASRKPADMADWIEAFTSGRYPLIVDPRGEELEWLLRHEAENLKAVAHAREEFINQCPTTMARSASDQAIEAATFAEAYAVAADMIARPDNSLEEVARAAVDAAVHAALDAGVDQGMEREVASRVFADAIAVALVKAGSRKDEIAEVSAAGPSRESAWPLMQYVLPGLQLNTACAAAAEGTPTAGKSVQEIATEAAEKAALITAELGFGTAGDVAGKVAADMAARAGESSDDVVAAAAASAKMAGASAISTHLQEPRTVWEQIEIARAAAASAGKAAALIAAAADKPKDRVRASAAEVALKTARDYGLTAEAAAKFVAAEAAGDKRFVPITASWMRDVLEFCLSEGLTLIVTEVEDFLPPAILSLLERQIIRKGRNMYLNIDGQMMDLNPSFRFYMLCTLPYLPQENVDKVELVNIQFKLITCQNTATDDTGPCVIRCTGMSGEELVAITINHTEPVGTLKDMIAKAVGTPPLMLRLVDAHGSVLESMQERVATAFAFAAAHGV